jgi:hypothetical protein
MQGNWHKLDNEHWYKHVLKSVETSHKGKVTILWNQQVQTDRTIPKNKPNIITQVTEEGTCMLIDFAFSGDRNMIKKEAKKILKYKDLTIEIWHMWNVKTKVTPIATGNGKHLRIYLSHILGKCEIKGIQKIAILGTAHILWKVLM